MQVKGWMEKSQQLWICPSPCEQWGVLAQAMPYAPPSVYSGPLPPIPGLDGDATEARTPTCTRTHAPPPAHSCGQGSPEDSQALGPKQSWWEGSHLVGFRTATGARVTFAMGYF